MADAIYDERQGISEACTIIDPLDPTRRCFIPSGSPYRELMQAIFIKGQLVYKRPSLSSSQEKTHDELGQFHETIRRILNPHHYPVGLVENLYHVKLKLILKAKGLLA